MGEGIITLIISVIAIHLFIFLISSYCVKDNKKYKNQKISIE